MISIEDIHRDLRSAMNGVAATAIRSSGMGYHVTYGVELPRLRQIAAGYPRDRKLALQLWQTEVREMRIMATMLYPHEEFDTDMADVWISSLTTSQAELAGHLAMNLLANISGAAELAFHLIADDRTMHQLCGFMTITRLLMAGAQLQADAEAELRDQAEAALHDTYLPLRQAANNTLLRL